MYNVKKIAAEIFQAPTKQDLLERYLSQYIKNSDGTYSSNGDVKIDKRLVKNGRLIIKFKEVKGDFYCYFRNLTSLEGAPESVGGDFLCYRNKVQFTEEYVRSLCKVKGNAYV